jgi:thiopurine S-methyltransferase
VHVSGNVAIVEGDIFSLDNAGPESRSKSGKDLSTVRDGGAPPYATAADFGDGSGADGELSLPRARVLRHSLSSAATDALAALGARVTRGAVKTQNKNKTEKPYASDADASYAADARVGARHSISFAEECLRFAAGGGPAMDAVWDRGALVAVAPDMRDRYARVVAERIAPGGRMLLVTVSYDEKEAGADAGPPFSVPDNEVRRLYEPLGLSVRSLGSEECLETAPPRMRERLASMRETVYLVEKPRQQKKRR